MTALRPDAPAPEGQRPERRQRARHRKELEILRAAQAEFEEKGYDGARMVDVAERADVSAGTLYGYFGTKENLLDALVTLQQATADARIEAAIDNPPDDLTAAVIAYMRAVLASVPLHLDFALWRQVYAAWILRGNAGLGATTSGMEEALLDQLRRLLGKLDQKALIRAGTDIGDLTEILHAANLFHWLRYLIGGHADVEELLAALERQVILICGRFTP